MCVEFGALSTLKICQNESICVVFLRASLLLSVSSFDRSLLNQSIIL